jgi:hypothetical protein
MVDAGVTYWLTPVAKEGPRTPLEVVRRLVVEQQVFAIGEVADKKSQLQPGDRICFYATRCVGVVADARVASRPSFTQNGDRTDHGTFPYVFDLDEVRAYLDRPILIDRELRGRLDAFAGRDPDGPFAFFVMGLHRVSERDFGLLTRASDS